jgi:hypothetical protein
MKPDKRVQDPVRIVERTAGDPDEARFRRARRTRISGREFDSIVHSVNPDVG